MFNQRELTTLFNKSKPGQSFRVTTYKRHETKYTNTGAKQIEIPTAEVDNGIWFFEIDYKNVGNNTAHYVVNVSLYDRDNFLGTGESHDLEDAIDIACQDAKGELLRFSLDLPYG